MFSFVILAVELQALILVSINYGGVLGQYTTLSGDSTWSDDLAVGTYDWSPSNIYDSYIHGFWATNDASVLTRTFELPTVSNEIYNVTVEFTFAVGCTWDSTDFIAFSIGLDDGTIFVQDASPSMQFQTSSTYGDWSLISSPYSEICSSSNYPDYYFSQVAKRKFIFKPSEESSNNLVLSFYSDPTDSGQGITDEFWGIHSVSIELETGIEYYECNVTKSSDDLIISWGDLVSDANVLNDTSISLSQGINNDSGTFEVTVTVQSKYLVGATYDDYSDYYEDVTDNGYLGVTYVLDTNQFGSEGRLLEESNSCENRVSSSFTNGHFLNSFWNYTLFPSNSDELGNDMYLEYGDQNIWDLELVDDFCGIVEWKHTFSFEDLWNDCKDSSGSPSFVLFDDEDDSDEIEFLLNFYLTIVSPHPLYLQLCDNGASDCGQYLVKTLISHPLSVIFSKTESIISNNDNIFIDLFTSNFVASIFGEIESSSENSTSYFQLSLITTVPSYMALNIDSALMLSPTSSVLESNNNNLDFIEKYYVIEETDSYMTDDCLILTDYRCFQKFSIIVELSQCPENTGLEFDASYYFSADYDCIADDSSVCDEYASDEPLSVTLDSINLQYTELCDSTVYEIDWNGLISFYPDESYDESESDTNGNLLTFAFGDTIYTRISISDDIANYQLFGMSIVQCYLCTADVDESNTDTFELSSCLDASSVDATLFYSILDDGLDYDPINSNISDTIEDFSFTLPVLADNTFYVDCTVELEINNVIDNNNNNRRRLTQTVSGNVFQSVMTTASVSSSSDGNDDSNSSKNSKEDESLSLLYLLLIIIGGCIIILVIIGIVVFCRRSRDKSEKGQADLQDVMNIKMGRIEGNAVATQTATTHSPITP